MKLTLLASLIIAVAILVTADSVGFGPDHAEATGHEELQNKVDAMNLLIAKTVTLWGNEYSTLRVRSDHQWMDWGQDGCSNPEVLSFILDRTYNIKFRDACLRHDWMWRTLAALDGGTGKMWNERNRWKADKQILTDASGICWAEYLDVGGITNYLLCAAAASGYHQAIRNWSGFRVLLNVDEDDSVTDEDHALYDPGMRVMTAQDCSPNAFPANRCLPISYVTFNDNPYSPQNNKWFPTGTAVEMVLHRANLQSVDGAPAGASPRNTGELLLSTQYPFIIGDDRDDVNCSNQSTSRTVYADSNNYPVTTEDDDLKPTIFYLKACATSTAAQELEPQLEIHAVQAKVVSGAWVTTPGTRLRHYQHINSESPRATLAPRPDSTTITVQDTWSAPMRLTTTSGLTSVDVVANPNDDTPLLEATTTYTNNHCGNGAETNDTFEVTNRGTIKVMMCGVGTGTLQLRDPTTQDVVSSYVVEMASPTPDPEPVCPVESISGVPSTQNGSLATTDCQSTYRAGRYIDYYQLRVSNSGVVTIDLTQQPGTVLDTYLEFYNGTTFSGAPDYVNDDANGTNSRLILNVIGGRTYTIGASTEGIGATGDYHLHVSLALDCQTDVGRLTGSFHSESDQIEANCLSANRTSTYAHFFTFSLSEEKYVQIDHAAVQGTIDAYVFLLEGAGKTGAIIEHNDDLRIGTRDSRITRILQPGSYTVEATTWGYNDTGHFTLTWRLSTPTAPPAPTGVTASANGGDSATVNWTPVEGASAYRVQYRRVSSNSAWVSRTNAATGSSYEVLYLSCNTAYQFRVFARGDGVDYKSLWSTESLTSTTITTHACG